MLIPNAGRTPFVQNLQLTPKKGIEAGSVETPVSLPQDGLVGSAQENAPLSLLSSPFSPHKQWSISNEGSAPLTVPDTTQALDLNNPQQFATCVGDAAGFKNNGVELAQNGCLLEFTPEIKAPEVDSLSSSFRSIFGLDKFTPYQATAEAARVGVPGNEVPATIPRVPNLTEEERVAETRFATAYEKHADAMASELRERIKSGEIGDGPNIFSTDDAKLLSPDYNPQGVSSEEAKGARAKYNLAVHQTANALAKKAFLQELDQIAKKSGDKHVLVTSGGVGAGKSYALGNVERTKNLAEKVDAIWDSAGEQNATELPWVLAECQKRGIKPTFVHVHQDAMGPWTNLERGVIPRAQKSGRMVDARLYADSHVEGTKNFQKFFAAHSDEADFIIIDNTGKPREIPTIPRKALSLSVEKIYAQALDFMGTLQGQCSEEIYSAGCTRSLRVWGEAQE